MSINTSDIEIGIYLLNEIHNLADQIVKRENLKRLNLYISFLKENLSKQFILIIEEK